MNDDMTHLPPEVAHFLKVYRYTSIYVAVVLTIILILLLLKLD